MDAQIKAVQLWRRGVFHQAAGSGLCQLRLRYNPHLCAKTIRRRNIRRTHLRQPQEILLNSNIDGEQLDYLVKLEVFVVLTKVLVDRQAKSESRSYEEMHIM